MGFPEEQKKLKRWVGYRLVPDKDGGKPRKVPINAVTGNNAKSNDPATWCDYRTESYISTPVSVFLLAPFGFSPLNHRWMPSPDGENSI